MPGSVVDLQTVAQNIVQAIQNWSQTLLGINATANAADISAATLVKSGAGRVVRLSITVAGSANGAIYDANTVSATTRKIFTIPNTLGIVDVNFPMGYGIVVAPGTGQTVAVSYS